SGAPPTPTESRTRTAARGMASVPIDDLASSGNAREHPIVRQNTYRRSGRAADMIGDPIPPIEIARAQADRHEARLIGEPAESLCAHRRVHSIGIVEDHE